MEHTAGAVLAVPRYRMRVQLQVTHVVEQAARTLSNDRAQLSNAQFELITSFALGRVIAVGSGSVGAIPLPSLGGVGVHDLGIVEQTGYLVVDGNVQ